jgi:hypothetical protein
MTKKHWIQLLVSAVIFGVVFCLIQLILKVPVNDAIRTGLVATPLFLIGSYALKLFGETR